MRSNITKSHKVECCILAIILNYCSFVKSINFDQTWRYITDTSVRGTLVDGSAKKGEVNMSSRDHKVVYFNLTMPFVQNGSFMKVAILKLERLF